MAEHNPEAALKLLKTWRTVICRQVKALDEEDIKGLEGFMKQSAQIQQQLQKILKSSPQLLHNGQIAGLLRELHQDQGSIIESLKGKTEALACEIGTLRRNKTSLEGYKKKKESHPRFMSKRT